MIRETPYYLRVLCGLFSRFTKPLQRFFLDKKNAHFRAHYVLDSMNPAISVYSYQLCVVWFRTIILTNQQCFMY